MNDTFGKTWSYSNDVTVDNTGAFTDVFQISSNFVSDYDATATGQTSGTATTTFTDANASADLDQCANGSLASPNVPACDPDEWVNGNLGTSKSHYFEGDSIPYRMKFDNLSLATHSVTIEWDTTKSSKHALDYLTTFDRTVSTADPCAGISGCGGSPSTFPIPVDSQVTGAGVTQIAGNFTMYGGTITAVSGYSYPDGSGFVGDKSAQITLSFTATVGNPVLAWGGHIATRVDWGAANSAVAISGSPYHTRLIDLDGSGGNQDRSLSADAVIFPGSITIIKDAVPDDPQDFSFSTTGGLSPATFSLDDDADNTLSNTQLFSGLLVTTPQGNDYTVTEGAAGGCTLSFANPECTVTSSNGGTQTGSVGTRTLSINLQEGENVTCTFTNTAIPPKLHLRKVVVNDNGGSALATAWTLTADGTGSNDLSGTTPVDSTGTLQPDTWALSESGPAGYSNNGWVCVGGTQNGSNITVGLGGEATCTITNDDNAPSLHLRKVVVNDNGGTKTVADFTLTADGTGTNDLSGTSPVDSGAGLLADTFALSETTQAGYTASAWSCVKDGGAPVNGASITLGLGDTATCTITNDDNAGTIIIRKITKPLVTPTSFNFDANGTGYVDFALGSGGTNTQTLNAGSYTVTELVPLGWVLTGIGGSSDPNFPYNCTVTGSGGSTGVGDLNTQTATISLENGDTVTCVFENTGQGVTRTQGFWATHTPLANIAWFGGTAFGHTFPGVAGVPGIGDTTLCGRPINTLGKLMGGFWSNISKKTTGVKRSALDQARMQLLQQLLAAELNASAFGTTPSVGTFAAWEAAYCGTNTTAIKTAQQQAASFNNAGDSSLFTPGTSADSKYARSVANKVFWDVLP